MQLCGDYLCTEATLVSKLEFVKLIRSPEIGPSLAARYDNPI
jgi:hypothetical protein